MGAELNLRTNKLEIFQIYGVKNYPMQYGISKGNNINWNERYSISPYVMEIKEKRFYLNMDMESTMEINSSELTGIEQAINDGAEGKEWLTDGVSKEMLEFAFSDGNLQRYYTSWEECLADAKKLNILKKTTNSLTIGKTYKYHDDNYEVSITIIDKNKIKIDSTSYTAEFPKIDQMTDEKYPYETTYTISDGVMQIQNAEQDRCSIFEDGTIEFRSLILK